MTTAARLPRPAIILAGAATMMSLGMGMRQSLGLFLPPMTHSIALTAADFTLAVAVQNITWGLCQAPVGAFADRHGMRLAMMAGGVLYIIGMLAMLVAQGPVMLAVSGAFIGMALACTASSLAMTASARAVPAEKRSQILGLVGACSSVGTLVIAPIVQEILARWHWHVGVLFFIVLAAAMIPAAFMAGAVDRMPPPAERRATMGEVIGSALTSRPFLVMATAYFVCGLQLIFLTTHLPNYLAICGQSPMLGASALATIGGVNIFGSWFAGWLGARFPKYILLGLLYVSRSVVITLYFITPPTPASTIAFAAAMGMLWLGVIPLVSGYVAELFGTRYMATILGLSFVVHQLGSVIGAWGGGLIFDAFHSYDYAWRFGVTMGVIAGVAQITLGGPVLPGIGRRPRPALVGG
ncbi:MFS transporter [Rhodopila sp.]|jgi:MFS family permease|uniref:MFS transporter n=1 Tax=Rhodopila sp. TaxID=2480087 RepID=UPI002CDDD011|nr:MFS transporter [Rhodopila sp.]HVZ09541.1 MFS transporter [Rhodopila sp.]